MYTTSGYLDVGHVGNSCDGKGSANVRRTTCALRIIKTDYLTRDKVWITFSRSKLAQTVFTPILPGADKDCERLSARTKACSLTGSSSIKRSNSSSSTTGPAPYAGKGTNLSFWRGVFVFCKHTTQYKKKWIDPHKQHQKHFNHLLPMGEKGQHSGFVLSLMLVSQSDCSCLWKYYGVFQQLSDVCPCCLKFGPTLGPAISKLRHALTVVFER